MQENKLKVLKDLTERADVLRKLYVNDEKKETIDWNYTLLKNKCKKNGIVPREAKELDVAWTSLNGYISYLKEFVDIAVNNMDLLLTEWFIVGDTVKVLLKEIDYWEALLAEQEEAEKAKDNNFGNNVPIDGKIVLDYGSVLPSKANEDDAGYDLYTNEEVELQPKSLGNVVKTGVYIQLPKGYYADVRPRSGFSTKSKLRVIYGTVDNGYQGEIGIIVDNLGSEVVKLGKNIKLAQLVFQKQVNVDFEIVDKFIKKTDRGDKGFGSTGYK